MNTDDHDEQDDLWCLLGQAKEPVPSSFFSRNVLRAIREEAQEKAGVLAWLHGHWQVATVGACAVMMAGFALMPPGEQPDKNTILLAEKVSQSPDYMVIVNFDELLASEESSVWLEN